MAEEGKKDIRDYFIPRRQLKLLGYDSNAVVKEDELDRKRAFHAVILRTGIDLEKDWSDPGKAEEVLHFLDQHYSLTVPNVAKYNGYVDRITENGVQVVFEEHAVDAVAAAVQIREEVLKKDTSVAEKMNFGIAYGQVLLGSIGTGMRHMVISLSNESDFAGFLLNCTLKYRAHILVTETFMRQDEQIALKYAHRLLGEFYYKRRGAAERIYDIFDSDEISVRTAKRKTVLLFDKGVVAFLEGDFAAARSYFIEVLKADRSDKAARVYLSLCDTYRDHPPVDRQGFCLEVF